MPLGWSEQRKADTLHTWASLGALEGQLTWRPSLPSLFWREGQDRRRPPIWKGGQTSIKAHPPALSHKTATLCLFLYFTLLIFYLLPPLTCTPLPAHTLLPSSSTHVCLPCHTCLLPLLLCLAHLAPCHAWYSVVTGRLRTSPQRDGEGGEGRREEEALPALPSNTQEEALPGDIY